MRHAIAPIAALALAAAAAPAFADTCPWLAEDVAAQAILEKPAAVTVQKEPIPPDAKGLVSATTCRFKAAGELTGHLAVYVMDFGNEANAKARYEGELKSQGSRARPARIDGNPGFFTMNPGFSAASYAQKGRYFVFVSQPFSKKVKEAIAKDPDGSSLSTHEIAKRVLAKL